MPFSAGNIINPNQIDQGSSGDEVLMSQLVARDEELLTQMSVFGGPSSVGVGSVILNEGNVTISANTTLSGVHYYDTLTIDPGVVVTADAPLSIKCSVALEMPGATLTADGQGALGGAASGGSLPGNPGEDGFTAPGAGGGSNPSWDGGAGGNASFMGQVLAGGLGGTAGNDGADGTALTVPYIRILLLLGFAGDLGGAGGGSGGHVGDGTGKGGRGGGFIDIETPILNAAGGIISAKGEDGEDTTTTGGAGAGGGGGGLNINTKADGYTAPDILSVDGGLGGIATTNGNGGKGTDGVKQVNLY